MMNNKSSFKTMYVYLFTFTMFVVGLFYGIFIYNDYQRLVKKDFIKNFITDSANHQTPTFFNLLGNFLEEFSYFFILWFLCLTVVGIIVVIFVVFFIGFIYGFTFTYFIDLYGYKGFYIGLIYTFPKNLYLILLLIFLTSQAMILSIQIFLTLHRNHSRKQLKKLINKYFNLLFFMIVVLLLYILTDAVLSVGRVEQLISLL